MQTRSRSLVQINIAVLLFGVAGLFGKFLATPAVGLVFGRTFFAGLTLALILIARKEKFLFRSLREYTLFFLLGIILAVHWVTFFYAIEISTVAIGLLTYSTFPIFVTFLEPVIFKEALKAKDLFTALVVFTGLVLIIPEYNLANAVTLGIFWGTVSGLTFAVLSILNRKYVQTHSSMTIAFYQNSFACLCLVPFMFLVKHSLVFKEIHVLLILGVIFTALAHTLFIQSLTGMKAQLASVIACLEPVYGIILAVILLGEYPNHRTLAGGILIVGATIYASFKKDAV